VDVWVESEGGARIVRVEQWDSSGVRCSYKSVCMRMGGVRWVYEARV